MKQLMCSCGNTLVSVEAICELCDVPIARQIRQTPINRAAIEEAIGFLGMADRERVLERLGYNDREIAMVLNNRIGHSVCPDCNGGWTFDFQQKRVYCRQCEASDA